MAHLKHMYANSTQNNMSNPIEKGLNADDSDVQELQNAFEAGLNIDGAEKPDFTGNKAQKVCVSCKDEKQQWQKGFSGSSKLNSVTNNDEHSQTEQGKPFLDSGEPVTCNTLFKCRTFPCSVHISMSSLDEYKEKASKDKNEGVNSEQSLELKNAPYGRTFSLPSSFKLKSALRGGQERSGLGPRPILSVKWAPDVQEPHLSSISHTVKRSRQSSSRKKDKKHKNKGKSGHASENSKNSKKRHSKRSYNSENFYSRLQSSSSHGNSILLDVWASRNPMLMPAKTEFMELGPPIFKLQTEQNDISVSMSSGHCCEEGKHDLLAKCLSDAEYVSPVFKCANSLRHMVQNKYLSFTEAA